MNYVTLWFVAFLAISLPVRLIRLWQAIQHSKQSGRGRISSRPIFWVMTFSYFVYLAACAYEGFLKQQMFSFHYAAYGWGLYWGALALREKAMGDLGRFFSPNIEIRQEHQLVREGLYRYMRHPLLVCMILEVVGVGFVFNSFVSFWIGGVFGYIPLIFFRRWMEEKALMQSLGDFYRRYQDEVSAFGLRLQVFSWRIG